MNFEQNKFGHPFNPGNGYFNDLSGRIQQRAGIEVIKIQENVEPKIEFTRKQRQAPVQLTVEFGFPLTSEKIEKDNNETLANQNNTITDIGEIHIEPINLKPNATPYWHEFNADDELEGLVLDSEGQEMSDITITGDLAFDLDQQIFHETTSISTIESANKNETIVDISPSPIVDEVVEFNEIQNVTSNYIDEISNELISSTNAVEEITPEAIVDLQQSIEAISLDSDAVITEITSTEINAEVSNEIENINREFAIADESSSEIVSLLNGAKESQIEEEYVPSFAFSFVPEVAEEVQNQVEIAIPETTFIEEVQSVNEVMSEPIVGYETTEMVAEVNVPQEIINEVIANDLIERDERQVITELTFSDADLDSLHEQLSSQLEPMKTNTIEVPVAEVKNSISEVELEFSDAELDLLHESMSNELPKTETVSATKSIQKEFSKQHKVYAEANSNSRIEEETVVYKPSIFDMIPWSSVFGVVASLMAIASAWFIWNSIQKPIAIDEFIDKTIAPTVQVATPVSGETVAIESNLSPSEYIATSILEDINSTESTENTFRFSELSERSKVSAVELEKLGLTTLNLEDGFFEEPIF